MKGRIEDPEKRAAANRARSEKQRRYWNSAEGKAVKERMRKERTGRQTEAHKRAMADPAVHQRIIEGMTRVLAEEPGPNEVTDEERAAAAAEERREADRRGTPAGQSQAARAAGPDRSERDGSRTGS